MLRRIVVVLFVLLQGCASAGSYFTLEQANLVKNGMTREEVIAVMGSNPYSIFEGGKALTWSYAQSGVLGQTSNRAVTFRFDEQGKTYGVPPEGAFGDIGKYLNR